MYSFIHLIIHTSIDLPIFLLRYLSIYLFYLIFPCNHSTLPVYFTSFSVSYIETMTQSLQWNKMFMLLYGIHAQTFARTSVNSLETGTVKASAVIIDFQCRIPMFCIIPKAITSYSLKKTNALRQVSTKASVDQASVPSYF